MLRGRGIPLLEKCLGFLGLWFLACCLVGFLVFLDSWFQSFLVSKFLGFSVSKLLGLKVSWLQGFLASQCRNLEVSKFQ